MVHQCPDTKEHNEHGLDLRLAHSGLFGAKTPLGTLPFCFRQIIVLPNIVFTMGTVSTADLPSFTQNLMVILCFRTSFTEKPRTLGMIRDQRRLSDCAFISWLSPPSIPIGQRALSVFTRATD